MRQVRRFTLALGVGFISAWSAVQPLTAQDGDADFYRGYYQQHASSDYQSAQQSYERAIANGVSATLIGQARQALAGVEEELAAADFAALMPSESLAFVEIDNPGKHVELLAKAMGLTGDRSPSESATLLRIEGEIAIPSNFKISPALLREIRKFRGAAISIVDIREDGPPVSGVAVIHPGDSDLLGGLLDTGVQLVPSTEQLGGFPTFQIENDVWMVKTHRLLLISDNTQHIKGCLARLANQASDSLADAENFQAARDKNPDAAVFAFVNPKAATKRFSHLLRGELSMVRIAFDLDHMDFLTAAVSASGDGVKTNFSLQYEPGHNSFGYGLVRTAPLSDRALKHVPSGAAVVTGLGLNPQMMLAAQAAGGKHLSALDIGRELFANMEEVAVFVLPSTAGENNEVPNLAAIIASGNLEKSNQLWNELLSLPANLEIDGGPSVQTVTLDGIQARQYTFPDADAPQLVIAKLGDEALIAGTRQAVEAALAARRSGATLATDDRAKPFWAAKGDSTTKALYVNVGRAMELAAQMEGGRDSVEMREIGAVLADLTLTATVNETDTNLDVRAALSGLPSFEKIIKTLAKRQPSYAIQASVSDHRVDRPATDKLAD